MADDKEQAMQLADLYHDPYSARRALDLSWAQAQAELRELGITPSDAALYQELAGHLLFPHTAFKALPSQAADNKLGQAELWGLGISGDAPILLATINSSDGLPSVRQLLRVHHYWRLKGIICDLVILNEHPATYLQELSDELMSTVMASTESGLLDRPGGVFIRRGDLLKPEDITLLHAVARIQVDCDGLGLGNFLEFPNAEQLYDLEEIRETTVRSTVEPETAEPAARATLQYFNGLGGFNDRHEYEIRLEGDSLPPAPGSTSLQMRTADSSLVKPGRGQRGRRAAFSSGLLRGRTIPFVTTRVNASTSVMKRQAKWTPTPEPVRHRNEYIVRHGAGYSSYEHTYDGLTTSLRMGVPKDDAVKLQVLNLTNNGTRARKLSIVNYVEWILGVDREKTQPHVRTSLDEATGIMIACNFFQPDFSGMSAFAAMSEPLNGWTASRREFLGRNGSLAAPDALRRQKLSRALGDTVDPCAALESTIEIAPGETKSIAFVLGAAKSDAALKVVAKYRTPDLANAAIDETAAGWRKRLGGITVRSPEPSFDLIMNQWAFYQALSCRFGDALRSISRAARLDSAISCRTRWHSRMRSLR
jgi:Cellobiose phosphorylase